MKIRTTPPSGTVIPAPAGLCVTVWKAPRRYLVGVVGALRLGRGHADRVEWLDPHGAWRELEPHQVFHAEPDGQIRARWEPAEKLASA